jgi:hypothetical protein
VDVRNNNNMSTRGSRTRANAANEAAAATHTDAQAKPTAHLREQVVRGEVGLQGILSDDGSAGSGDEENAAEMARLQSNASASLASEMQRIVTADKSRQQQRASGAAAIAGLNETKEPSQTSGGGLEGSSSSEGEQSTSPAAAPRTADGDTSQLLQRMMAQMLKLEEDMREMRQERRAAGVAQPRHSAAAKVSFAGAAGGRSPHRDEDDDQDQAGEDRGDDNNDDGDGNGAADPAGNNNHRAPAVEQLSAQQRREAEQQFDRIAHRRKAEPVTSITYCAATHKAADSQWLENWLRELSRQALGLDTVGSGLRDRVQLMLRAMDRDLESWYAHTCQTEGEPQRWSEVEARLRRQFITVPADKKAAIALMSAQQLHDESLDAFLARVQSLHRTAGALAQADDDAMVLRIIYAADATRFMKELSKANEQYEEGKIRNLTELRVLLSKEEIKTKMAAQFLARSRGAQPRSTTTAGSSGKQHPNKSSGGQRPKQINEVACEQDGYEGSDEDTASTVSVNALQNAEIDIRSVRCVRCKKKGHWAKECKGQEKRQCYNCQKFGHLSKECSEPKGKKKVSFATAGSDKADDAKTAAAANSAEAKNE